ncbi:MAG TPA: hypothetical protein VN281_03085 [Verrucomicrobiae bacterium]|jgi:hypothetical protein|nr:hypothetical protein [Verrucomicrobiae bacterium]
MLVLDENLPAEQRLLLRKWRIRFRVVGLDVGTWGTDDYNVLPLLHRLAQPTFFTLDGDFYRADWAHPNYALVWLDVTDDRAAEFIRRFLRHPAFTTQARRLGTVARVHSEGISFWRTRGRSPKSVAWPVR